MSHTNNVRCLWKIFECFAKCCSIKSQGQMVIDDKTQNTTKLEFFLTLIQTYNLSVSNFRVVRPCLNFGRNQFNYVQPLCIHSKLLEQPDFLSVALWTN